MIWKNYDYGVFGFPKSRVIVQDTVVADSYIGNEVHIFSDNFFFLAFILFLSSFSAENKDKTKIFICLYKELITVIKTQ